MRIRTGKSTGYWITFFVFKMAILFCLRPTDWRLYRCWPVAANPWKYRTYIGPLEIEYQPWP